MVKIKKMKNIRVRVAAIILNKKNELLLVNHRKNKKSYWLFPGGGVEYGETFIAALKREIKEELCINKIRPGKLAFLNDTIYPGGKRHIINIYFKVKIPAKGGFKVMPDRVLKDARFFSLKEFKRILFYPDIKNVIMLMWKDGFTRQYGYIRTKWKD